ncbi:MAG: FmdB family zinc ribbon protein [Actinomycetota bacterium]
MPIYSYICRDCRHKFELLALGERKEELECKKCGSKNIQKTFSSFGVVSSSSKGSGEQESSCPTGTCSLG